MGTTHTLPLVSGSNVPALHEQQALVDFGLASMFDHRWLAEITVSLAADQTSGTPATSDASAGEIPKTRVGSDLTEQSEYFLEPAKLRVLQESVHNHSLGVSAGMVERNGKQSTMAHLVEALAASGPGLPSFNSVHTKRMLVAAYLHAVLTGKIVLSAQASEGLAPGTRVVRGPDWRWQDQDGGAGRLGTVKSMQNWSGTPGLGVSVVWDSGTSNIYRYGYDNQFDVAPAVSDHKKTRGKSWADFVTFWTHKEFVAGHDQASLTAVLPPPGKWGVAFPTDVPHSERLAPINALIKQLFTETTAYVDAIVAGTVTASNAETANKLVMIVSAFAKFLFAHAATAAQSGPSAVFKVYEQLVISFSSTIFAKSNALMAHIASTAHGATAPSADVVAKLDKAVADLQGKILRFLAVALSWFSSRPAVAICLLPELTKLAASVTSSFDVLAAAKGSEVELESKQQRSLVSGTPTPIGQLHHLHDLAKSLACLGGKLSATTVKAVPENPTEQALSPWLKSAIFSGGIEASCATVLIPPETAHLHWDTDRSTSWTERYGAVQAAADNSSTAPVDHDTLVAVTKAALSNTGDDLTNVLSLVANNTPFGGETAADEEGGEPPVGAADQLLAWLASIRPDARSMLSKKRYPDVEAPFFAAVLKHSGLLREAKHTLTCLSSGADVTPSPEMLMAWARVGDLRHFLRTQRMYGKEGLLGGDASLALARGGGEAEDKPASSTGAAGHHSAEQLAEVVPIRIPSSFAKLRSQVRTRCRLLLCFTPPRGCGDADGGESKSDSTDSGPPGQSQLEGKWMSLLPPPSLPPLLSRWRSYAPSTTEAWAAPAAIKLERASSSSAGEREIPSASETVLRTCLQYATRGAGAPPAVVLQVLRRRSLRAEQRAFGLKGMLVLLKALELSSAKHDALVTLRPALRGAVVSAKRKESPAATPAGGEEAATPGTGAGAGVGAGSAVARQAQASTASPSNFAPDATKIRHHYRKGLEGAAALSSDKVQAVFIELYIFLADELRRSYRSKDIAYGHLVLWTWGLDFDAQDHEFLLRVALMPTLHAMFSLTRRCKNASRQIDLATPSKSKTGATPAGSPLRTLDLLADDDGDGLFGVDDLLPVPWQPWPTHYVRAALNTGSLTKRELVLHIKSAPPTDETTAWVAAHGLNDKTRTIAGRLTVDDVATLYENFVDTILSPADKAATSGSKKFAATLIQTAYRGFAVRSTLKRQNSGEFLGAPTSPRTGSPVGSSSEATYQFRGRLGTVQSSFRAGAWALFRLILTGVAGGRRGLKKARKDAVASTDNGWEDLNPASARGVLMATAEAAKEVAASASFVLDSCASVTRFTSWLQKEAFTAIKSELKQGSNLLSTIEGSDLELAEVESSAFQSLAYLTAVRDLITTQSHLASKEAVTHLLALLDSGSPRILRLVCVLLRDVLRGVAPDATPAMGDTPSVLVKLLNKVAAAILVDVDDAMPSIALTDSVSSPFGYGAGHVRVAAASSAVAALRQLLEVPAWAPVVKATLEQALARAEPYVSVDTLTPSVKPVFSDAAAALAVLGGFTECLRVGVRACQDDAVSSGVSREAAAGTVVVLPLNSEQAQVVFDPALPPVSVYVSSLCAIDDVPLRAAAAPATPGVISFLLKCMALDLSVAMPKEEKMRSRSSGGDKKSKKAKPAESKEATTKTETGATDISNEQLWLMQVKSRATKCLARLCASAHFNKLVADTALFGSVLKTALQPVNLPTFVSTRYLEERQVLLQERLLEWSMGVRVGASLQEDSGDTAMSAEELAMRETASNLVFLGDPPFSIELCVAGLKMFGGEVERVAEWLLNGQARIFESGGGLDEQDEEESSRFKEGRSLATIVGLPPSLCYLALQLFDDNKDAAMNLLFDRGSAFVPGLATESDKNMDFSGLSGGADDSAALDDLDLGDAEPLIDDGGADRGVPNPFAGITMEPGMPMDPSILEAMETHRRAAAYAAGRAPAMTPRGPPPASLLSRMSARGPPPPVSSSETAAFASLLAATSNNVSTDPDIAAALRSSRAAASLDLRSALEAHRQGMFGESKRAERAPERTVFGLAGAGAGFSTSDSRGASAVRLLPATELASLPAGTVLTHRMDEGDRWRLHCVTGAITEAVTGASDPSKTVRVRVLDVDTGLTQSCTLPLGQLQVHSHLFAVKVAGSASGGAASLRHLAAASEQAVAIHAARRAAVAMLAHWPAHLEFGPSRPMPADFVQKMVSLFKLVAAGEGAFQGHRSSEAGNGALGSFNPEHLMESLESRFQQWLLSEGGPTEPAATDDGSSAWGAGSSAPTPRAHGVLSEALVDNVATNMLHATSPGLSEEREMVESLHPHWVRQSYTDKVSCRGARAMWVTFDPRTETAGSCMLSFYGDSRCNQLLMSCSGASPSFRPFVVHSDTVYFRFHGSCNEDSVRWGFRFWVTPMQGLQWLRETQVVHKPSLEWACWVLEFLLNDAKELVDRGVLHNARVFNAMVHYLRARGTPFKHRVIALLTQLLKAPHLFDLTDSPNLGALSGIEGVVMAHCMTEMSKGGDLVFPSRLLQLVELITTTHTASRFLAKRKAWAERQAGGWQPAKAGRHRRGSSKERGRKKKASNSDPLPIPFSLQRVSPSPDEAVLPPVDVATHKLTAVPTGEEVAHMSLIEPLVDVMDIAEAMYSNARLPDPLVLAVLAMARGKTNATPRAAEGALHMLAGWTPAQDAQLVLWASSKAAQRTSGDESKTDGRRDRSMSVSSESGGVSPLSLNPATLAMTDEEERLSFPLVADFSPHKLRLRFALLKILNSRLKRVMPLLDVMNARAPWALGYKLRALSHCIFVDMKEQLLQAAINKTWTNSDGSGINITLDNGQHREAVERAGVDPAGRNPAVSKCMFVQVFQALNEKQTRLLRSKLNSRGLLFHVSYRGEDGSDWGGLYRDCLTRMTVDLFSSYLDLFLLCPNGQTSNGMNTEKYLPNPRHTTPLTMKMYEFVGKLIGISLRTRNYLEYELPPIIWKLLGGAKVGEEDLKAVDLAAYTHLRKIRDCTEHGITDQAAFEAEFYRDGVPSTFTFYGADSRQIELVPNGEEKVLTFENRQEYVTAAMHKRLHEFDAAARAMRKGLVALVPDRALRLLTWRELEILACGDPVIDLELLKSHTQYVGSWDKTHEAALRFWRVMEGFSHKDRSKFIRFCWGRSRLPKPANWSASEPFKLTKHNGSDSRLPLAHTCFFQIELPCYTTDDIMKKRLLAAINFGVGEFLMA